MKEYLENVNHRERINAKLKVGFSINLYDSEGDSFNDCIVLHIGDNLLLKLDNAKELELFIANLVYLRDEMKLNYGI